ncbi:MAG: diacylglycerol kinase family protein [Verrucomicrobiota bacterium]
MRPCVIFNPAARGEKAKRFRRYLDDIGSECALKLTWAAGVARQLAAEAVTEGFETIVAAGGDGTLNEVLNGIGDVPDGFAKARLGVLPLGTVNVFAKEYAIPTNIAKAWAAIQLGHEIQIDLPKVEFGDGRERRFFAQLAGAGLDAMAIERINWETKKVIGPLAYVVAGARAMGAPQFTITTSNGKETLAGELVLVGNGRFYGGKFVLFPEADARDGLLEVCVFPKLDWGVIAKTGCALLFQNGRELPGARYLRCREFELTSSPAAPLEVEGEGIGTLPAKFSVEQRRLRVVVPR